MYIQKGNVIPLKSANKKFDKDGKMTLKILVQLYDTRSQETSTKRKKKDEVSYLEELTGHKFKLMEKDDRVYHTNLKRSLKNNK